MGNEEPRVIAAGKIEMEAGFVNVRIVIDRQWVARKERLEKRVGRTVAYRELLAQGIVAMERG